MPDLERHVWSVTVQLRRFGPALVVAEMGVCMHHQQRRGLGQVAVEQLVQLMAQVEPGGGCGGQPHQHHGAQQAGQQPSLQ